MDAAREMLRKSLNLKLRYDRLPSKGLDLEMVVTILDRDAYGCCMQGTVL